MTDDGRPRRRKLRDERDDNSLVHGFGSIADTLRQIEKALVAAEKEKPGSPEALACCQRALGEVALAVKPALGSAFDSPSALPKKRREDWTKALRFLDGALVLPERTGSLALALAEISRGLIDDALIGPPREGQGQPASAEKLYYMRIAVDAVDEIIDSRRRQGLRVKDADDIIALEGGMSLSTLRKWREKLKVAPQELRPGFGMQIEIRRRPVEVLKQARRIALSLEAKGKKYKSVE